MEAKDGLSRIVCDFQRVAVKQPTHNSADHSDEPNILDYVVDQITDGTR